ncbi:MAG: sulfatase-like hydrolase/transferase, partial [Gammaproteobacteria bacterium]
MRESISGLSSVFGLVVLGLLFQSGVAIAAAPIVDTEIPNQTGTQGTAFGPLDVSSNFSDPDGDALSFGADTLPDGLTLTGSTISGTPTQDGVGTTTVTVTATDPGTLFVTDTFDIVVANINDTPEVDTEIPNQTGTQGTAFSLDVSSNFSDPDGDTLSFGADALPDGLTLTGSTISGTPTQAGTGTTTVTITATDPGTLFVTDTFDIVVADPNLAPEVDTEIPNQTGTQGTAFSLDVSSNFSDPDGDTLSFGADTLPDGLTLTGSTISGTPTQAGTGTTSVTVTVTDPSTLGVTDTFDIVVSDPNLSPVVETEIANQSVSIAVAVEIDVSPNFSDPDGDSVTFLASGLPDGLSITGAGVIQGTASDLDQGPSNVTITARDPSNATGADTFVLTVQQPPNVVLIFADDLGYGDIGVYGASNISTPNIDSIATGGVRFTDFYASPTCGASRTMLLTGSYASRVSLGVGQIPSKYTGIHQDEITLAELLASKGYATSLVGKWHLGDHHQFLPQRHGFDEFYGLAYSNNMWPFHPRTFEEPGEDPRLTAARNRAELTGYQGQGNSFPRGRGYPNLPLYDGDRIVEFNSLQDTFGTRFVDEGINFINRNSSGPFFLYLALTAPHTPLHPASEFIGTSARGLYGDAVHEIDDGVGRILTRLNTLGIADNTLVMFISDNGPWLEYGIDGGSAGPLTGGKGTPFEGGIRVPAIMKWADQIPANTVTSEPTSLIDILPTLAPLAGTAVPVDRTIDGISLVPLITGNVSALPPRSIFSFDETSTPTEVDLESVRDGPWKLHVSTVSGSVSNVALYNLDQDIDESNNVLGSQSAIAASMRAAGQTIVNEISAGQRPLGTTSFNADPFLQYEGLGDLIVIEAEHAHSNIARGSHSWQQTAPPGASGAAGMQALPNNGTNITSDYQNTSPQLGYNVSFESAGRYYVWVRGTAGTNNDDSFHVGLDGQAPASGLGAAAFNSYYTWVGDLLSGGGRAFVDVPSAAQHTLNLWMREDGLFVDKIVLTKDPAFTPVGTGLIESRQGVGMPSLMPSDNNLTFTVGEGAGSPPDQTVSLDTSDGTQATYTVESSHSWLSATPTTGNTKADLVVSVDPTGLAAGTHNGTIMISAPGFPAETVTVTLVIVEPPPLSMLFSVSSLGFSAIEAGPSPANQTVSLSTSDSEVVSFSIGSDVGWLSATPLAGTTPVLSVAVSVNSGTLAAGVHVGTLTASASGYVDDVIAVAVVVEEPSSAFQQDPATGLVSMEVEHYEDLTSAGAHSWTPVSQPGVSGGQSLQALPNNGTNIKSRNDVASSPRIDLVVNFAQTGTHYIWLRGLAPSGADNTVHAGIDGVAPNTADGIRNFTSSWTWTNTTLGASAPRAFIDISSVGEHTLNLWMREDGLILDKVILTTDSSFTPSGDGPEESVQGPGLPSLKFDATVLDFAADTGGSLPTDQTIAVGTSDGQPVEFGIGSDQSWLTATPSSGTTPAGSIAVSVDHSSLVAGSYSGTLTVSGTGYEDDTISVSLEVIDPPPLSMQFDVSTLSFNADEAGPSPADQAVSLSTTDSEAVGFSIDSDQGWLSATPLTGTTPVGSIAVSVNSSVL